MFFHGIDFPFTHDLGKLAALCAAKDPSFNFILKDAASLNPYPVEMRYDDEFWPTLEEVTGLVGKAKTISGLVIKKLPAGLSNSPPA